MSQSNKTRVCLFTRVSTSKQDNERQILELNDYCQAKDYTVTKIIATKITGSKIQKERPDLQELLAAARDRQFNKVLVTEISRIGRNARDIRKTIDQLHEYGVSVIFKNLGVESLDDRGEDSLAVNLIISIFAELSQQEKRLMVERIKSGLNAAKAKGRQLGRPVGQESKETVLRRYPKVVRDLKTGVSLRKVMKLHSVSKGTVIKVKRFIALT